MPCPTCGPLRSWLVLDLKTCQALRTAGLHARHSAHDAVLNRMLRYGGRPQRSSACCCCKWMMWPTPSSWPMRDIWCSTTWMPAARQRWCWFPRASRSASASAKARQHHGPLLHAATSAGGVDGSTASLLVNGPSATAAVGQDLADPPPLPAVCLTEGHSLQAIWTGFGTLAALWQPSSGQIAGSAAADRFIRDHRGAAIRLDGHMPVPLVLDAVLDLARPNDLGAKALPVAEAGGGLRQEVCSSGWFCLLAGHPAPARAGLQPTGASPECCSVDRCSEQRSAAAGKRLTAQASCFTAG